MLQMSNMSIFRLSDFVAYWWEETAQMYSCAISSQLNGDSHRP